MPTYEYKCANGHQFEQFQRMTEAPLETCPTCGAAAERQMSAGAGLHFKGSGFYITDYRSESYRKAAAADRGDTSADKPAATASEKPAATASEKPAEKPAAKPASDRAKSRDTAKPGGAQASKGPKKSDGSSTGGS